MIDSTLIFIDGENLSLRYQDMVKSGAIPAPDNIIIDDCFVWNPRILKDHYWNLKRLSYYTSVVGDDNLVREVREKISHTTFTCNTLRSLGNQTISQTGQFIPFVRKKSKKSRKEGICDIMIAVDVMRACYRDHAQTIWLFSGDGDFIQLFEEVVHSGKQAYASAFSSGLCNDIRFVVDEFIPLDKYFFVEATDTTAEDASTVEPDLLLNNVAEQSVA
ncbi:NYN domain-containing protein [Methylomagnum sp.]